MSKSMRLAVPSVDEGGLDGVRSAHFGHCDCFTLVDIVEGAIAGVRVIGNPPHAEGGCLRPVNLLASSRVDALLAAGMGARPLQGFNDVGIAVYFETETLGIREAVEKVIQGTVPMMELQQACGGH